MEFASYNDMCEYQSRLTGIRRPFSGRGIFAKGTTVILRSVDGTEYYADNLSDPKCIIYTMQGKTGDQSLENKDNRHLMLAKHIWVYRVQRKKWIWYGLYHIESTPCATQHVGADGIMRTIYLVRLGKQDSP